MVLCSVVAFLIGGLILGTPLAASAHTLSTGPGICGHSDYHLGYVDGSHTGHTLAEYHRVGAAGEHGYCYILFSTGSQHGFSHYMSVQIVGGQVDSGNFEHYAGPVRLHCEDSIGYTWTVKFAAGGTYPFNDSLKRYLGPTCD